MQQLSDIQSAPEELQDYYEQLRAQHVTPAWLGGGISLEPQSQAVPYVWHWRDLRPQAMRAAELVGTQQAERRVLRLTNPNLPGIASNTLVANIQIVMPGEIARAHRHSGAALRLIIEGQGGYTVVNGERVPMAPGDLVLTPNWSWHDHVNDTDAPMIWLDGLDTPLVRMLEAGFYEEYHQERQELAPLVNASEWHYPMSEMRAALERAREESAELVRKNQQEVAAAKAELIAAAKKQSDELLAAARKTISEEKRQALAELRAQAVDIAIEAAGRLVQMNMDDGKQKQLVEEYLSQLPKETRV